jgi:PAS domain S-box-containing protein
MEMLSQAMVILTESLAPYEMRQRGFKDLIGNLNIQNQKLQSEVEQREKYEEELKQSKEHFQNLIENALDIVTVLDHNGTILYESPSLNRILGFEPDELIGKNVFSLIHEEDIDLIKQAFTSLIKAPDSTDHAEFRFRHKNGSWRYLESIAKNVMDSSEGECVIVNSRDVTDTC